MEVVEHSLEVEGTLRSEMKHAPLAGEVGAAEKTCPFEAGDGEMTSCFEGGLLVQARGWSGRRRPKSAG